VKTCDQCGVCCKLFLINLSKEEYFSGVYKTLLEKFGLINDFKLASECGANILKQKKDGSCFYLKKNSCSIHQIRPQVCRKFFCASKAKKFQNMIKEIEAKEQETNYFVYILKTSSNTLYIGQTNNLEKRIAEHKSKSIKSAKYIKYFDSFELVYSEVYKTRSEAMKREYQLKQFTKTQKENLITGV